MEYYNNEIPQELLVGEKYSQTQLINFIAENLNVTVISKSCNRFSEHSHIVHRVLETIEGYEHKSDTQGKYLIQGTKTKVYILD